MLLAVGPKKSMLLLENFARVYPMSILEFVGQGVP